MKVSKIQSSFRSKNGVVKFNSNKFSTFIKWAFLPKSIFVQNCFFFSNKQINSIRLKNFPIFKISYTKLLSIFLIPIKFRNFVHLLTISPLSIAFKMYQNVFFSLMYWRNENIYYSSYYSPSLVFIQHFSLILFCIKKWYFKHDFHWSNNMCTIKYKCTSFIVFILSWFFHFFGLRGIGGNIFPHFLSKDFFCKFP